MKVAAFIQARMSSRRFPGKMLAPYRGVPIVDHVVDAARAAYPGGTVVVLTSEERSDDPLAAYLASRGSSVFRGPLDDVLGRFRRAADALGPFDFVVRICGDSPVLAPSILQKVLEGAAPGVDLVTTTHPRTFPRGQNVEILAGDLLRRLDQDPAVTAEDREHVTRFVHAHPDRFRIVNVASGAPQLAELHHAVDTLEDLERLERTDVRAQLEPAGL